MGLCETWLSSDTSNMDIEIAGFSNEPFRADSPQADTHKRGGVCMYYDVNLPISERKDLCILDECIIAEIKLNTKKMFYVLIYRSPSQSSNELDEFIKNLESIIDKMKKEKPTLILLTGDLNARSTQFWSEETSENMAGKKLADLANEFNFTQLINEPTHIPRDNIQTCIDLILTDDKFAIIDSGVIPSLDSMCKHQIVHGKIDFHIPSPPKYTRQIWNYGKSDLMGIRNDVNNMDWINLFSNKTVDEMTEILTDRLTCIANNHIPNRLITVNDKESPWVTPEVRAAIKRNKRTYKNWVKRGKIQVDKPNVNSMQAKTNKIIKRAKESYIENLSVKICDPQSGQKTFWNAYKRLANKKKNTNIPPLKVNDNLITDFHAKAKLFNDYFAKQCRPLDIESNLPSITMKTDNTLNDVEISLSNISNIISKMNTKKAHGHDGISIAFIKLCSHELALPLKIIFDKCLIEGVYPDKWKHANVQPVHKKNSRQEISNYRPISLLPIFGKILEKLIFDSMYTFLQSNNLLSKNQSGFRPGDSTINQLLSITSEIYVAFEKYDEVRAVFLDISKAFDKVWHEGLLFKLKQNGICGNLLALLKNYLESRNQRVVLNGVASEWEQILSGVPQGSVLGPLLFLIFINDLTDNIESNMRLFADDSSLFLRVNRNNIISSHDQLIRDLDTIKKWADLWKMSFNPDITKQAIEVIFSAVYSKGDHPPLVFNEVPVARQPHTKHLGVILDERLTFRRHIFEAIEKATKGLSLMKFLSRWVTSKVLDQTYKMYVRPHLEYGDIIYHDQLSDMMDALERIQYQSGLVVSKCWKGTNRAKLYDQLGWESLSERRVYRRFCLFYKIKHNLTPGYLREHIMLNGRTIRFNNSFFPFCEQNWYNLDEEIRNSPSINIFKNRFLNKIRPKRKSFFDIHDKYGVSLIFKLRVDFSDLREHRFRHRFLNCPSPLCRCAIEDETTVHFLLRCPNYASLRTSLISSISSIVQNDFSALPDDYVARIAIFGSSVFNNVTNKLILESTINFLKKKNDFLN